MSTWTQYNNHISYIYLHTTYPAKKALIQLMINVCGMSMAMLPFIMPIMASMPAGSVIGLPAGLPLLSGSFRNAPDWYEEIK